MCTMVFAFFFFLFVMIVFDLVYFQVVFLSCLMVEYRRLLTLRTAMTLGQL